MERALLTFFGVLKEGKRRGQGEMGCEVDPAFIRPEEHRPKPTVVEAGGVPLIDLSPLFHLPMPEAGASGSLSGLVAEVEAACREWGFFQVVNHGVPLQLVERIEAAARGFFALPVEEKRLVARDEVNPLGFYDTEHTKNVRDWKEVFDFVIEEQAIIPVSDDPSGDGLLELCNQWPRCPPGFRETCEEYAKAVTDLGFRLLELVALSLRLPAKQLNSFFEEQTSFIRLNHYPPCPASHLTLGVGHHKDAGALTILYQDEVGGLDVKRRSDGEWVRIKPVPSSFVINIGDIIQVWSNDKYESAEHRVSVNAGKERFSIPFFLNPGPHVMVRPLEEVLDEKSQANYEEYNWGRFFTTRKNSNFKKLKEENLQIYHFRKAK